MKKSELKAIIKPIIEECIKEIIFEEGVLSSILKEAQKANGYQIVEQKESRNVKKFDDFEFNKEALGIKPRPKQLPIHERKIPDFAKGGFSALIDSAESEDERSDNDYGVDLTGLI